MKNLTVGAWPIKGLVLVFAVVAGIVLFTPHAAKAIGEPTMWVDDDFDGPDNDGGHTWGTDAFASISSATEVAAPDEVISIASGAYPVAATLHLTTEGLSLVGPGLGVAAASVSVTCGDYVIPFKVEAPNITISGLSIMATVDGLSTGVLCDPDDSYHLVWIDGYGNPGATASISNNDIAGGDMGVFVASSSGSTIANNNIHNNGQGINLGHVPNSTISGNHIHDNTVYGIDIGVDGSFIGESGGTVFSSNDIHGNATGVFWYGFTNAGDVLFTGNEVHDNTTGIDVENDGVGNFIINGNSIHDNTTGLHAEGITSTLNAIHNGWGSANGPTIADNPGGDGDSITLSSPTPVVYYRRFYTDVELTTLSAGTALRDIHIESNDPDDTSRAHTGETVTLSFTSDPALLVDDITVAFTSSVSPIVGDYTVASISDDELNWTASYIVSTDDTSGTVGFTISTDPALDLEVDGSAITEGLDVITDHAAADLQDGDTSTTVNIAVVLDNELTELGSIASIGNLDLILYGGLPPIDGTLGEGGATLSLVFSTSVFGTAKTGGLMAFGAGALLDAGDGPSAEFQITDSQITDHAGPQVATTLGNGSADVIIEDGDFGDIVFTEPLSVAGQGAVEAALASGSDQLLEYGWADETLTVTNDSGNDATFADDVFADVTDVLDNVTTSLKLVDSAPTPQAEVFVDDSWSGQEDVDEYNPALVWQTDAFNSIQDGIDTAEAGATVHVLAGTYNEEITINKSLTLEGLVGDEARGPGEGAPEIFDGICEDVDIPIIAVSANDVTIEGFHIHSNNCGNFNVDVGEETSGAYILDNDLSDENGNDVGVSLDSLSSSNTIARNEIHGYGVGIVTNSSDDSIVADNDIHNNSQEGIYVQNSIGNLGILGNDVHDNGHYGVLLYGSSNVTVIGNTANNNGQIGFFLGAGSTENELTANSASENLIGFRMQASSNGNTLELNAAIGNVGGFNLFHSSNNVMTANLVVGNTLDGFLLTNNANANELYGNVVALNIIGIHNDSGNATIIDGNTIGSALIAGEPIGGNAQDGIYIGSGSDISITNNQIIGNAGVPASGIHIAPGGGTGNSAHYNNISGNGPYGVYNDSLNEFDAANNYWGSAAGPGGDGINGVTGAAVVEPYLTENSPQIGEDGLPPNLFTSGVFEYSGSDETDTDSVTVHGDVTLQVASSSVTLLDGTTITPTDADSFSVASISATSPALGGLSGFSRGTVAEGAFQWGIPNLGLTFNPAITLHVDVGADLNGTTLHILRSPNGTSGWTSDGIVPPATCVVTDGICTFQATRASIFAPVVLPASRRGGSGNYVAVAPTPTPLPGLRPSGSLVRYDGDPRVYLLENGLKRWITTAEDFTRLGYAWSAILTIPNTETYPDGATMGAGAPAPAPTGPVTFTSYLARGSTGPEVRALQQKLQSLGFFPASLTPTSYFGPVTEAAVRAFQSAHGISPLGFVGPATRAALNR